MVHTGTIGVVPRDPVNYQPQGDLWSCGGYGELIYGGGTAFATAADPTAGEVIDGTGVVVGNQFRVVGALATGTLVATSAGDYLVELEIFDHSEGSATGNVTWAVEYAPSGGATGTFAAMTTAETVGGGGRMQAIMLALTTKERVRVSAIQRMQGNSAVRATVLSSGACGVVTVTEGRLRITKIADVDPPVTP